MSVLEIAGGKPLDGEMYIQGAKNAVLPILAATILAKGRNVIKNCPELSDVEKTAEVLKELGCRVERENGVISVDSSSLTSCTISDELMRQMRSSIIFLGAIIAAHGEAYVSMPGGCEIGSRPIDLHLKSLEKLGVEISENHGFIECRAPALKGADIHLDFPSVGATENIMLAASAADGVTTISNAAREPEIIDLANFLNKMGAHISGAGESLIRIGGAERLYGVEYRIMPDRIAAGTYIICTLMAGGSTALRGANPRDMGAMLAVLDEMGADISCSQDVIYTNGSRRLKNARQIRTMPYPGFPTDIQSPFMALCAASEGTTLLTETIFENRFRHVDELVRMGADIRVEGRSAVIRGADKLSGATVAAHDLRGGAALVAAALGAEGTTVIENPEYISRGYEDIEKRLRSLGADITLKSGAYPAADDCIGADRSNQ